MTKPKIDPETEIYAMTFAKESKIYYKYVYAAYESGQIDGRVTSTKERRRVILNRQSANQFKECWVSPAQKPYEEYPQVSATDFIGAVTSLINCGEYRPSGDVSASWLSAAFDVYVSGLTYTEAKKKHGMSNRLRTSLENLRNVVNQLIKHPKATNNFETPTKDEVLFEIEEIFTSIKSSKIDQRNKRSHRNAELQKTLLLGQKLYGKLNKN